MFCTKCGAQIADGANFCPHCGNNMGASNTAQQKGNSANNAGNGQGAGGNYTVYEKFSPEMGLGITFIITDRSVIVSNVEYLYKDMDNITLVNPPCPMVNGVAQTRCNGKLLNLAFKGADQQRFMKMLDYANGQIDKAHGTERKYRYVIQSSLTAKVEVYDDYIIVYVLKSGILATFSNSFAGGSSGSIVDFADLDVQINSGNLQFIIKGTPLDIQLTSDNSQVANEIVSYITNTKAQKQEQAATSQSMNEKWDNFVGEGKEFPIGDKVLMIPVEMDLFNSYRLKFRELASECADNAKEETTRKVQNLLTYLEFFPKIYDKYLDVMINKAIDILVAEEVWTVTHDSFLAQHKKDFHNIQDDLNATLKSIQLTSQNNQKSVASLTGLVPHLVGGGFGFKGAMKGIAKATAFNIVRDTAEASLVNGASQLNQAQQNELYGRIRFDVLIERAFLDYWRVFLSLTYTLKSAGKQMWYPSQDNMTKASNIFQNLSNPNFPEGKKLEMFLEILKTNPYKLDYQKFMINQWGETEQTVAIKNYFGFSDFNNPRMQ